MERLDDDTVKCRTANSREREMRDNVSEFSHFIEIKEKKGVSTGLVELTPKRGLTRLRLRVSESLSARGQTGVYIEGHR